MNDTTTNTLAEKWAEFKIQNPKVRIRDAAKTLETTEVQLLATQCGESVTRLDIDVKRLFADEIPQLGKVKAITRNDDVVHERVGEYLNPSFSEKSPMGLFVGEDIDLRIFLHVWKSIFAVEEVGDSTRKSIQFFDKYGMALHKIYLIAESNESVFDQIVTKYKHEDQSSEELVLDAPVKEIKARVKQDFDVESFQNEWRNLSDTHDFFGLIRKYDLTRIQALESAPAGLENVPFSNYAERVPVESLIYILQKASEQKLPIMVFVGNHGIIQIHTGQVERLLDIPNWYNVIDPEFNLHVRLSGLEEAWIVRKPTKDGVVTALEFYDKNQEQILQLFGKRKPGIPEDANWRKLVDNYEA